MGIVFLLLLLMGPQPAYATTYGQNSYGTSNYGGVTTTSSSTTSNTSQSSGPGLPPGCSSLPPGLPPPRIYAAIARSATQLQLYFTDASAPFDHYVLTYGLKPGNYVYGIASFGTVGTRTVTVGQLKKNTRYYFKIRGGNGCATGAWSAEFSGIPRANTKKLSISGSVKGIQASPEPIYFEDLIETVPPTAAPTPSSAPVSGVIPKSQSHSWLRRLWPF